MGVRSEKGKVRSEKAEGRSEVKDVINISSS